MRVREAAGVCSDRVVAMCTVKKQATDWKGVQYAELIPPDDRHDLAKGYDFKPVATESVAMATLEGTKSFKGFSGSGSNNWG